MKIHLLIFVVLVAVWGCAAYSIWTRKHYAKPVAPGVIPSNSVFHKPPHADCPPGTQLVPKFFSEKDGSTLDACHNPLGDGSIDYLNPGEGCSVGNIQIEDATEEGPKT